MLLLVFTGQTAGFRGPAPRAAPARWHLASLRTATIATSSTTATMADPPPAVEFMVRRATVDDVPAIRDARKGAFKVVNTRSKKFFLDAQVRTIQHTAERCLGCCRSPADNRPLTTRRNVAPRLRALPTAGTTRSSRSTRAGPY